jgi:hypothetical protein
MASFSFGFSGDNYEEDDSHSAEDVAMDDNSSTANAVKPEIHRIEHLVGSSLPIAFHQTCPHIERYALQFSHTQHTVLARRIIVKIEQRRLGHDAECH